jgi:uncharacterized LabA/DUF88 family protein
MNRYVVMVDAGYLLRQAIEVVSGRASTKRADLEISNPLGLIQVLLNKATSTLDLRGKELLRVYWYDGVMSNGMTHQQHSLIGVDDVLFRAGTINGKGQQKGVDSLIVTDLIELTSHHAISDAVLVTGDSDLAVGLEIAQKRGVRIAVLGVEDLDVGVAHHQSFEITSRADRLCMLGQADLLHVMRYVPTQALPAVRHVKAHAPQAQALHHPSGPDIESARIETSVKAFISQQGQRLDGVVDPTTKRIEASVDRALLHHVFCELGHGRLSETEKVSARKHFREQLRST